MRKFATITAIASMSAVAVVCLVIWAVTTSGAAGDSETDGHPGGGSQSQAVSKSEGENGVQGNLPIGNGDGAEGPSGASESAEAGNERGGTSVAPSVSIVRRSTDDMSAVFSKRAPGVDYAASDRMPYDGSGRSNLLAYRGSLDDEDSFAYRDVYTFLRDAGDSADRDVSLLDADSSSVSFRYTVSYGAGTMSFIIVMDPQSEEFVGMFREQDEPSRKTLGNRNADNPLALGESTYDPSKGVPSAKQYGTH